MRFLLNFQLITICLTLLIGCGLSSKKDDSKDEVVLPTPSPEPPYNEYFVADPDCQTQNSLINLDQIFVHSWQNHNLSVELVTPPGILRSSRLTLNQSVIKDVTYGQQYFRECDDQQFKRQECHENFRLTSSPQFLRVCKSAYSYPRLSLENVALTAAYFIGQAFDFYKTAMQVKGLKLIHLVLFPKLQTNIKSQQQQNKPAADDVYETNNLAYFTPSTIAIFPETREIALNSRVHLWESRFVLYHEFAHHIEWQLIGGLLTKEEIVWSKHGYQYKAQQPRANKNKLENSKIGLKTLSAISEAFADLLAFYTEQKNPLSIKGMIFLGDDDRDINAAHFSNKIPKILTTAVLNVFFNDKDLDGRFSVPNYRDPHVIGSILAYYLNQILEIVVPAKKSDDNPIIEQYRLTIEWLKLLVNKRPWLSATVQDPTQTFRPVTLTIEELISAYLKNLDPPLLHQTYEKICERTKALMPAIASPAFSQYCPQ